MKKILFALMLLGPPLQAQHRSVPGTPGGATVPLTANGTCQVVTSGGTNSAMFAVTGTWTGTLGFFGTNDLGVTSVALQAYPVNTTTGALGSSSVNTTTGNGVWIADTFGMYQAEICATAAMTGSALIRIDADPAVAVMQVTGVGGAAIAVTGSLSVSGAADVVSAGAPTTFNANAICTGALLTAGLQSAGFHFDAGTLIGTFTAQCSAFTSGTTNFTNGGLKDVTGATVSGAVTNPNAQTDWTITCPGDTRRVQVCTTAFTSGSTTGQAVGTFYQTASAAGGGGGGVVTQTTGTNLHTVTDATSATTATQGSAGSSAQSWFMQIWDAVTGPAAVKAASTAAAAADKALVVAISPNNIIPTKIDQTTPGTTNGVVINNTANIQGLGTLGSPSGGPVTMQGGPGMTPIFVKTTGTDNVAANAADNFAPATLLNSACTVATACTSVQSIQWAPNGLQSAELTITAISSPVGITVACDKGYDTFNTTHTLASCFFWNGTSRKATLANADLVAGTQWTIYWTGSPSGIRARLATVTSGSVTLAGRSTTAPGLPFPVEAKPPTQATVTLTASTSETTLLAAVAGTFLDLTYLKCSNTSSTASVISIRDATAGTVRDTLVCPAAIGPCEGNVYKVPFAQTTSNANWTIQAGTSASSIICTAQAVPR